MGGPTLAVNWLSGHRAGEPINEPLARAFHDTDNENDEPSES